MLPMKHINTTAVLASKIPALALACALLLNVHVKAQIYTWDGGGANNFWNESANWLEDPATLAFTSNPSPNTIGVIFNSSSSAQLTNRLGTTIRLNSLEFSNLASDVVISNVNTAGNVTALEFRGTDPVLRIAAGVNNAVTFRSGVLETGSNLTIDHQGGGLLNFNSQLRTTLAGQTGGVTKTGSGTMVLFNAINNFTGGLFVQGGAVRSDRANGTFGYVFGSNSSGNAVVTLQGGALELYHSGNSTFSNNVVVQSNSTITSGRFALGGAHTYTFDGTLTMGAQTLTINAGNVNSGTAGIEFAGATTLTGNGTLLVTNNLSGVTTSLRLGAVNESGGSYGLTKAGNGLLTLTAGGDYSGGTTIQGGTLAVASDSFLGNGGGVSLAGGTWQIGGSTAFNSARAVAVTASSTLETTNPAGATLTGLFSTTSSTNILTVSQTGALTLDPGQGQTNTLGSLYITGSNTVTLASGTTQLTSATGADSTAGLLLRNGSLILDGGNLVTTNNAFAQFGGNVLTIKAGSTYTSGGNFLMAYGGTSTLNLSGGSMTVGGEVRVVQSGSGVMNLDAGLLRLGKFFDVGTGSATVNFNGATVQASADTAAFADTSLTTYRVQSGGAVFDTDGRNITFGRALLADAGSPGGGLVKNGDGTLTLTAANTFTGATSINAGSLVVNGSSLSATTINSGGTLGGTGSITSVTVGSGGTLSPGNSPGLMTITDTLTLEGGGAITWELADFAGSRGGGWDAIDAFSLDISALSSSSRFTINILNDGPLLNFNPSNDYSFNFLVASNSISNFDSSLFVLNTLGFAAPTGSSGFSWSITQGEGELDNTLYLNYVVPEPSTYALLTLAGLGFAGHVVRRRYRPRG
jgi:autotransporter-associated beta strand protein